MFKKISQFLFSSSNEKKVKKLYQEINKINKLEAKFAAMADDELQNMTNVFKSKLTAGSTLDDILHEAFAVVREASKRVLKMRHFDVQLIGGINLHRGNITEMGTGEGKTLASTTAAYLNALEGKGVHIITVNDYLAFRDSEEMGRLYNFLGLSVGCILSNISDYERKTAYQADITYGTNNEFGFDYLRDNMKLSPEELVQRKFNFAIIDEVDSILIDESRTPLIISGPTDDNSELYSLINKIIPKLSPDFYEIDEKSRTVNLTEEGNVEAEKLLIQSKILSANSNLYDIENVHIVHHLNQALKAHKIFKLDVDYMINNRKILIIDEFTGRALEGRRFSEGLHQALEAKENLPIQNENQTLASITFQNYFRLYPTISGMTGTALTEAQEFLEIYNLGVLSVPTNKKKIRQDFDDEIYRTSEEKYDAIIKQIKECNAKKQPILIGTVSIEKSEYISKLLNKEKIPHKVLNAKYHEQEAEIIAQAGTPSAVTIATNMAGRGTDIMLGGNPEMLIKHLPEDISQDEMAKQIAIIRDQVEQAKQISLEAGGLYVLGTERHESRRIDNQLRGRAGRQGDPGNTKFYLSLEDDLMRIFASDKMSFILQKLGLEAGEAIQHPMISRALEKAQQRVESRNYDIRKNLLKFDDVSNEQRKVIYEQRFEILESDNLSEFIWNIVEQTNEELIQNHVEAEYTPNDPELNGFEIEIHKIYGLESNLSDIFGSDSLNKDELNEKLNHYAKTKLTAKEELYSSEVMRLAEKKVLLLTLDQTWKEHLHRLDHLRQGINLRSFGQKDPLNEYKRESFEYFQEMISNFHYLVVGRILQFQLHLSREELDSFFSSENKKSNITLSRSEITHDEKAGSTVYNKKIARNELCPCESGKKYKHCHGKLEN
jgi:preprotein translocase subunit SecA